MRDHKSVKSLSIVGDDLGYQALVGIDRVEGDGQWLLLVFLRREMLASVIWENASRAARRLLSGKSQGEVMVECALCRERKEGGKESARSVGCEGIISLFPRTIHTLDLDLDTNASNNLLRLLQQDLDLEPAIALAELLQQLLSLPHLVASAIELLQTHQQPFPFVDGDSSSFDDNPLQQH